MAVGQAHVHWMIRVAVPIIGGSPVHSDKLFVSMMVEFGFDYTNRSLTIVHCVSQIDTINHIRGLPVRELDCSDVTCDGFHSHPASKISS